MRKRYHKFNHNDGLLRKSPNYSKTKKKYGKKSSKKKTFKFILASLVVVFLVMIGYVIFSSLTSASEVFTGGVSITDLVRKSNLKQENGITNILLLGKGGSNHPGGQLTDTIILMRIRQDDSRVAMISIPRDLYVPIPGDGKAKINQAYTVGWNSAEANDERGAEGAKMASQVITDITGAPIHYYVTADFVGFKDLIDTLGGVTVDVQKDLYDPMYPDEGFTSDGQYYKTEAYDPLYIKAGTKTLDGELALKYVRSRHGTGVSDFDRAKRQQQVLYAAKEKMLSLGVLANPKKITSIFDSLGSHIKTNMQLPELKEFIGKVSDIGSGDIINEVIDNSQDGLLVSSNNGSSILLPKAGDFDEIEAFVTNIFDQSILRSLEVEVYNGSGIAGDASEFAEQLEGEGFTVTIIDDNDEIIDQTTVYSSTNDKEVMAKIEKVVPSAQIEDYDESGIIKIIIGKDGRS